jgi:hypothetical protein
MSLPSVPVLKIAVLVAYLPGFVSECRLWLKLGVTSLYGFN